MGRTPRDRVSWDAGALPLLPCVSACQVSNPDPSGLVPLILRLAVVWLPARCPARRRKVCLAPFLWLL